MVILPSNHVRELMSGNNNTEFHPSDFFTVEGALNVNNFSINFRRIISNIMSERAAIEVKYIKMLQQWMDHLGHRTLPIGIYKEIITCFYESTKRVADLHQDVYNRMMSGTGPYHIVAKKETFPRDCHPVFEGTNQSFEQVLQKKRYLEAELKKWKMNFETNSQAIEEIESQLTQRSRITSSRLRPGHKRPTKKIDAMRASVSQLRRQADNDKARIESLMEEIKQFEAQSKKELFDIVPSSSRTPGLTTPVPSSRTERVEGARNLMEMTIADLLAREEHMAEPRSSQSSSSDVSSSLMIGYHCSSSGSSVGPGGKPTASDQAIETIHVPHVTKEETGRRSPPFRARQFCPGYSTDDEEDNQALQNLDDGTKIERFCSNIESHHAEGRELGTLRNLRVISLQSYVGTSPNELTLKKGQIIKQKLGADEDGFCYGWTRESRFSPKQYGKYPLVIVKAYDSEFKTNN
ncbi:hypothetical protein ACJMK2_021006 [Sinanodonta woodiana]|uniref:SH3 domain-containing protein n=1 Tax=Sinanodonta woodiana TaxID=1069815 RepID=A0ABD3U0Y0_SINWO